MVPEPHADPGSNEDGDGNAVGMNVGGLVGSGDEGGEVHTHVGVDVVNRFTGAAEGTLVGTDVGGTVGVAVGMIATSSVGANVGHDGDAVVGVEVGAEVGAHDPGAHSQKDAPATKRFDEQPVSTKLLTSPPKETLADITAD